MEPRRDDLDLVTELQALRPTPRAEFAAELDARAAAGFPREAQGSRSRLAGALDRLRSTPPRRLLASAGALALTAIVVATVAVAVNDGGGSGSMLSHTTTLEERFSAGGVKESAGTSQPSAAVGASSGPYASHAGRRSVERDAQIVFGADPSEVRDVTAKVFETVHSYDGVVLNSSIADGTAGDAGASFELLIPSAKLSDALASLSGLAEVRSRHESSQDITAPTVGLGERLRDARAKIEGLLGQLADAGGDEERAAVEAELRAEREHAAALRSRLTALERRANLSRVSLRIETGAASSSSGASGPWGIDDALRDAARILAIAVGVTVVGLAILAPLALLCLFAWLAHRAWTRQRREQALG